MPIEVQHQPPLNIVGAAGYNAGVMEGVAKRREELWNRQMQVAQMQQADRAQRLNLLGQQQAQQAANQRMLMENYLDQQNAATQNQQRIQAFGMEQQAQMQRDSRLHDFDMQKMGRQQDFQVMEQANSTRGELEQLLGKSESMNLTPDAQNLRSRISNDLDELNKNLASLRPGDYNHAVQEIYGRAQGLMLPRMQAPTANPAEEIKAATFDNPEDGYSYTKTDKGWKREGRHTVNGKKVGEIFRTDAGQDVFYDKNGDLKPVPSEVPKLKANVMDKIEKAMAAEEKGYAAEAPIPTFDSLGHPTAPPLGATPAPTRDKPDWMLNPQNRQSEKMRRFWSEWSVISGEPDPYAPNTDTSNSTFLNGQQQGIVPSTYDNPTSGVPQYPTMSINGEHGTPGSFQNSRPGQFGNPPQQPQATAANPSGQPQQPQEVPTPEAAAQQAMNPQQPQQPAAQQQPAQQPAPVRISQAIDKIIMAAPGMDPVKIAKLQLIKDQIESGQRPPNQLTQEERDLLVEIQQEMRAKTGTAPRNYMQ